MVSPYGQSGEYEKAEHKADKACDFSSEENEACYCQGDTEEVDGIAIQT